MERIGKAYIVTLTREQAANNPHEQRRGNRFAVVLAHETQPDPWYRYKTIGEARRVAHRAAE